MSSGASSYSKLMFQTAIVTVIVLLSMIVLMRVFFPPEIKDAVTRVRVDVQVFDMQLHQYRLRNDAYPTTAQGLQALVEKPVVEPVPKNWSKSFDSIPLDSWKQPYHYLCPGVHNRDGFDVWSSGRDKIDGTADDIGNWHSR